MLYKYRTWHLFFPPTSWLNQSVHWRSVWHIQTNTISHSQQWGSCHLQLRSIKTGSRAVSFYPFLLDTCSGLQSLTCSTWHFQLMTYLHPPCWLSRPHFSPLRAVPVLHYVPPGVLTEGYLQPSQQGCQRALSRALLSGLAPVTGSSAAANKGIHHDGQEPWQESLHHSIVPQIWTYHLITLLCLLIALSRCRLVKRRDLFSLPGPRPLPWQMLSLIKTSAAREILENEIQFHLHWCRQFFFSSPLLRVGVMKWEDP